MSPLPIRRPERAGGSRLPAGALALLVLSLAFAGPVAPALAGPGHTDHPRVGRLILHWNDAADTSQTLHRSATEPLRVTVCITGVDTLQGYTVTLRGLRQSQGGTAWSFRDTMSCGKASWAMDAEADPRARAPWRKKLSINDLRHNDDGTIWALMSTAFDLMVLDPDSTYALFHLDLTPPAAKDDAGKCGWDGPAQFYAESAELLINDDIFQMTDLGRGVRYVPEPPAATTPAGGAAR